LPDLARQRRWRKRLPQIARNLGCNPQTARNAIHKFSEEGLEEALSGAPTARIPFIAPSTVRVWRLCARCYT
jgi:hypothetical protein